MNASNLDIELRKKSYLIGKTLKYAKYQPSFPTDHTFCVFCWARISAWEEDLHDGYCEEESNNWVCDICIEEYQNAFEWTVEGSNENDWLKRLQQKSLFDIPLI